MNKLAFLPLAALFAACGLLPQEVVVVTATPPQATAQTEPVVSPSNTPLPAPTNTPEPTRTPAPEWDDVPMGEVETALREDGYRRFPFTNDDGESGFTWIKANPYEQITTREDGLLELQVLHDGSAADRADRLEDHFAVLDRVFPAGLMAQLRLEHTAYNRSVPSSVTGDPDETFAFGDDWNTVWAEYNVSESNLGGYSIRFSLWWSQSTCPPQYDYCYYPSFPGLEFTGDSSFVFHTVLIWLPDVGGLLESNS